MEICGLCFLIVSACSVKSEARSESESEDGCGGVRGLKGDEKI